MPASAASLESLESSATPWLGVSQPLQHRDSEGSPILLNAVAVLPRNTGGGRRECKLQRIATLSKVPTTYIFCLDTPSLAYVAPMDYWWREAQ